MAKVSAALGVVLAAVIAACGTTTAPPASTSTPPPTALATPGPTDAPTPTDTPTPTPPPTPTVGGTGEPPTATPVPVSAAPSASESAPARTAPPTASSAATQVAVAARTKPPTSVSLKPGQTPRGTPLDLGPFLTATLEIIHLGDQPITVSVAIVDGGTTSELTTLTLQTLDGGSEPVFAGDYLVTFKRPADAKAATCSLHVADGESFRFVTTDRTTAVFKAGATPRKGADVLIGLSPLCKAKG